MKIINYYYVRKNKIYIIDELIHYDTTANSNSGVRIKETFYFNTSLSLLPKQYKL